MIRWPNWESLLSHSAILRHLLGRLSVDIADIML